MSFVLPKIDANECNMLACRLTADLGFADIDCKENIRRTAEVGRLMVDAGVITLVYLISPFEQERRMARALFVPGDCIETFIDAPPHVLERRDPKGLYAKARKGLTKNFTGIDSPYERPVASDIVIDSTTSLIEQAAHTIETFLRHQWVWEQPLHQQRASTMKTLVVVQVGFNGVAASNKTSTSSYQYA